MNHPTCSVDGCDRRVHARGWCGLHYRRWQTHGVVSDPVRLSLEARLLLYTAIENEPLCWLWNGPMTNDGYGYLRLQNPRRNIRAHRAWYELANGPAPAHLTVRHSCDTPPCCNPEHLFLGTQADNMHDMAIRRRSALGIKNGQAKLSEQIVAIVRLLCADGRFYQREIAAAVGVSQTCISKIARETRWGHL